MHMKNGESPWAAYQIIYPSVRHLLNFSKLSSGVKKTNLSLQVFIPNTKIFTSFLKILKESPSSLDSYCIFGLKQFVKFSNHTKNQWRYWLTEYPSYFPL